jgi:L-fucose mutarotase
MDRAVGAILSVLPVDDFEPGPVRRMEIVGRPAEVAEVQLEVQHVIDQALGRPTPLVGLERFAFYDAARRAFAVVQCGDPRPYGCFLVRKGVIAGSKPQ